MKLIEKRITGSKIFISEPALKMRNLIAWLLLAKLPGYSGSSSPSILQNPPKGMALIEKSVSPLLIPTNHLQFSLFLNKLYG